MCTHIVLFSSFVLLDRFAARIPILVENKCCWVCFCGFIEELQIALGVLLFAMGCSGMLWEWF